MSCNLVLDTDNLINTYVVLQTVLSLRQDVYTYYIQTSPIKYPGNPTLV